MHQFDEATDHPYSYPIVDLEPHMLEMEHLVNETKLVQPRRTDEWILQFQNRTEHTPDCVLENNLMS